MNHIDFSLHIDFDRTLYDSHQFTLTLWEELVAQSGVPLEQLFEDSRNFVPHEVLGGYDFDAHVRSYGVDPEYMWEHLDTILKDRDFLYPDSAAVVQELLADGFEPRILSFGESRFQLAKIMPALEILSPGRPLHVEVVMRKKAEFLAYTFPNTRGALIDDVPDQGLPAGFTEIHIDRTGELAEPLTKDGGFTVSNLEQARQVLLTLTQ